MSRHMTERPRAGECPCPRADEGRSSDDLGASLVEILVAITLLGTVIGAVIASLFVSVKATAYERDHAKAQQWLQAAVGVIEAVEFSECDRTLINEELVKKDYQDAITVGKVDTNGDTVVNSDDGAKRPWQYEGELTVVAVDVWDGENYVPFDTQEVCYDGLRLRQQRVRLEVNHPNGVTESVEMVKVDR